ncbi:MAG: hypothetical protein NTU54_01805 [Candidatus Omnitrophica bacterium]|nr:hypothetical protein [Candidatus Omnitrophota bacterium]
MKMLSKNLMVAIFGMGCTVGAIVSALGMTKGILTKTILLGIGFGLMLSGIFAEINSLKEKT